MKFSYTKNLESDFYKESKFNNKNKNLTVWRGGGGGVARVSDFFLFCCQKNPSLKKNISFLRG